jgi:hypothetical protein
MDWKVILLAQQLGAYNYECLNSEYQDCIAVCAELSDAVTQYRVSPSIRKPRNPFSEIVFSVFKNRLASGGKFDAYIEQAKHSPERIEVPCSPNQLSYLRSRVSQAKAGLSVVIEGDAVYVGRRGINAGGSFFAASIRQELSTYQHPIEIDLTNYSPVYIRTLVSSWNTQKSDTMSVNVHGSTATIYRRAQPVDVDTSDIWTAQKALKAGSLNLDTYDKCLAAMRAMEAEMKAVLNSEIIGRHIFG